uniref:Guanylate cyclase n=1 Tax=Tetranychus urticae TaxID=32264 RepID=T1KEH2_TETUR
MVINTMNNSSTISQPVSMMLYFSFVEMRNLTLNGISGDITIDEEGDRIADYALLDQTNIDDGLFEVVLRYYGATKSFTKEKEIKWPPGKFGVKPKDIPECGFKGNACDKDVPYWNILLATLLIIIALILVASTFIYHKVKLEAALANMSWKVRWEDIILDHGPRQSFMSKITTSSQGELNEIHHNEGKIICAHYKGNRVAIKKLPSHKIEVTREILMELKIMRETSHENLARFIGACIDVPNVILTEYCPKGSLRDLLMNFSLNLDWMFRFSLINDIIAGMCYLHSSEHIFHGRLKSTNCLVDSRFCIKLSDFGLEKLRSAASITANNSSGDNNHQQQNKSSSKALISTNEPHLTISVQTNDVVSNGQTDPYSILYISPDMLNNDLSKSNYVSGAIEIEKNKCRCTEVSKYKLRRCYDCVYRGQKADVYSYSVILQEIITRSFPFHPYVLCMDIKTIVNNIVRHDLRPDVPLDLCENKELYHHMVRCWSREPHSRPDFNHIKREIRLIARSSGQNEDSPENTTLTEKLLQRMEQYATELESIVEQRTSELAEEKKKTEELLYQILPRVVANQLKIGESVIPDYYDSVTVYFSDIVGFTEMCSESTPIEVVNFLNDLYTCFDSIISDYDVYKVETIGDAYMVVSGLPERNGHEHVRQIARMSLRMVESVDGFVIRHRKEDKLKLRIGIHSGPCCAGVVGNKRPRYCLFGDTINTASRMESTGEALKIHISSATKKLLDHFKQFEIKERGDVIIKGKGIMKYLELACKFTSEKIC